MASSANTNPIINFILIHRLRFVRNNGQIKGILVYKNVTKLFLSTLGTEIMSLPQYVNLFDMFISYMYIYLLVYLSKTISITDIKRHKC